MKYRYTTVSAPMPDTGLGRELGFEDDAAAIREAEAQRAALPPALRETLDEFDRRLYRAFIYGDDS